MKNGHEDPKPEHGKDNEHGHKQHTRPSGTSHAIKVSE